MDFLKIRKKAKERARSGGSAPGAARPAAKPVPEIAAEPGRAAPLEGSPTVAEPDAPAGGRPVSPGPPQATGAVDPRFTTWRPGWGDRPFAEIPDLVAAPLPPQDPGADDPARLRRFSGPASPEPRDLPAATQAGPAAPAVGTPPRQTRARDPLDEFFFRVDEEVPALAGLPADAGPAAAPGAEEAGLEEYLTFRLGVEEYAVAIERVREVLKPPPITEVPRAPAGVLGVVTVRGEVVAVFDPRKRLELPGGPPPEGSGRIVIVDDGEGSCGLLVDAVASVVRLARGSLEPCPQGIGGASADCLAGIGRDRSRLFMVLELGALLRRALAPARGGRTAHAGA